MPLIKITRGLLARPARFQTAARTFFFDKREGKVILVFLIIIVLISIDYWSISISPNKTQHTDRGPDPIDHATGNEKLLRILYEKGYDVSQIEMIYELLIQY